MKSVVVFILGLFFTNALIGQDSTGISYQAIVRTASGTVSNQNIGVQITILSDSINGSAVYVERHSPTTDKLGYVTLEIGKGNVVSGDFFGLDWHATSFFIQSEIDPAGGTNYSITGASQLASVPFAFAANHASKAAHAKMANSTEIRVSKTGDTLFVGQTEYVVIDGISAANYPAFPAGTVHCDPDSMEIKTVMSTNGKVWMDRNLGAKQVATAIDDSLSYGDLYQWGRFADGHQCRGSATTTTQATSAAVSSGDAWYGKFITNSTFPYDWLSTQDDDLWQGGDSTNIPCPSGFRLPTIAEWDAEFKTWSSSTTAAALDSPLKLPAAGHRSSSGNEELVGSYCYYSSSSVSTQNNGFSAILLVLTNSASLGISARAEASSIRCIRVCD